MDEDMELVLCPYKVKELSPWAETHGWITGNSEMGRDDMLAPNFLLAGEFRGRRANGVS
jgi:hypothetical protein